MASVITLFDPVNLVTDLDLQNTRFHILIHPVDIKYLRFLVGTSQSQFRVLLYNHSTITWVFTQVLAVVAANLKETEFR